MLECETWMNRMAQAHPTLAGLFPSSWRAAASNTWKEASTRFKSWSVQNAIGRTWIEFTDDSEAKAWTAIVKDLKDGATICTSPTQFNCWNPPGRYRHGQEMTPQASVIWQTVDAAKAKVGSAVDTVKEKASAASTAVKNWWAGDHFWSSKLEMAAQERQHASMLSGRTDRKGRIAAKKRGGQ